MELGFWKAWQKPLKDINYHIQEAQPEWNRKRITWVLHSQNAKKKKIKEKRGILLLRRNKTVNFQQNCRNKMLMEWYLHMCLNIKLLRQNKYIISKKKDVWWKHRTYWKEWRTLEKSKCGWQTKMNRWY